MENGGYRKGDKRALAYTYIRNAILTNRFMPGQLLNENDLCAELENMSRTPVREALNQLKSERLVETTPGRGTMVANISATDILELAEARMPMEREAVRLLIQRMDKQIKEKITKENIPLHKKALEEKRYYDAIRLDNEFHYLVAEGSCNSRIYEIVYQLIEKSSQGAYMTRNDSERMNRSFQQHMRIAEAIEAGDTERAMQAMSDHLSDWASYIINNKLGKYYFYNMRLNGQKPS